MAIELMEEIKAAELKADNHKAQAQHEGRELIKSVEEACLEHERFAQQEARRIYQSSVDERRAEVEAEIANMSGEKRRALEQMAAAANKKVPEAARLVFERIVNDGHR